jgi:hypothetical protein
VVAGHAEHVHLTRVGHGPHEKGPVVAGMELRLVIFLAN